MSISVETDRRRIRNDRNRVDSAAANSTAARTGMSGTFFMLSVPKLWPERCLAMVSVNGYPIDNLERDKQPLPPKVEHGWCHQFYFAIPPAQDC